MQSEATTPSELLADEFKAMVLKRTGLAPQQLSCPREKSDMTPCIARDGWCALAGEGAGAVCVGCGASLVDLHAAEKAKASTP